MTHAEFEALIIPSEALARPALTQDEWRPDLYGFETRDLPWPRTSEREKMWTELRRN